MGMPPMATVQGDYKDGIFSCKGFSIKLSPHDIQLLEKKGYNGKRITLGVRSGDIKHGTTYEHHFPKQLFQLQSLISSTLAIV